jgi:hypothetical protein
VEDTSIERREHVLSVHGAVEVSTLFCACEGSHSTNDSVRNVANFLAMVFMLFIDPKNSRN